MIQIILASVISGFICYFVGWIEGKKSESKFQIRIGGSNNKQEMK